MQTIASLPRATRFSLSVSFGAVVTVVLLIVMCSLIAMDPPDIVQSPPIKFDPVMEPPEEPKARPEEKTPKPPEAQRAPTKPDFSTSIDNPNPDNRFTLVAPPTTTPTKLTGPDSGTATAMFAVAPAYPGRALRKGIEGYVDLMFDVTASGKTENIRVLYADPKGYFESASIKTLKKWKYKPAMDDGVAIAQKNRTTRIKFELDH